MPIRANPATAALLAGSVSLSALILIIYLKLRGNQANSKQSLPKPDDCPLKSDSSSLVEQSFDTEQILSDCIAANTIEQKETVLCEELVAKDNQSKNPQSESEATEESISECENHLEEDSSGEEVVEEIIEEFIEPEVKLPQEAAVVVMTTSTDAIGDCAANSNSSCSNNNNNNNNNNVKVMPNELENQLVDKTASLTVDTGATNDAESNLVVENNSTVNDAAATAAEDLVNDVDQCESTNRVSNWLVKNECYRIQPAFNGGRPADESSPPNHQQREDASEDSGRPSSVDTAAEAASPRSSAKSATAEGKVRQSSTAVAVAMSLSPDWRKTGQQKQNRGENGGKADKDAVSQYPDRSKMIRGVSPVPGDENDIIHQFLIPNKLGGSMVGTRGRNINYIRAKSGASVWISRNFFDKKTQVVNVRGPADCVKSALQVIKKRFPELDVKPINTAVPIQRNPALQPTMCQLSLPVGALVDVNVCAMCRGTTVFMQQPTHPSFHHLENMDLTIMKHYADQASVPTLPRPVNPGAVCVAPFGSAWHRAIIADVFPEEDMVLMKYLDWGGYERMPVNCLKQIRTEMMHLPFQAVEGHLAYISPILNDTEDPEIQLEQLSRILHERYLAGPNKRIKAQVVYFNDVGQPCVYLYTKDAQSDSWRFLQEDLVQDGLAQWFQMPHAPPQMPQ